MTMPLGFLCIRIIRKSNNDWVSFPNLRAFSRFPQIDSSMWLVHAGRDSDHVGHPNPSLILRQAVGPSSGDFTPDPAESVNFGKTTPTFCVSLKTTHPPCLSWSVKQSSPDLGSTLYLSPQITNREWIRFQRVHFCFS